MERKSLDTVCAALCTVIGIEPPEMANTANEALVSYWKSVYGDEKADRIFMYNPDAVAEWIWKKYRGYLAEADADTELKIPLETVMPSVTPVCFGTMYTGAQPEVHGIRKYEKPIIAIDTIFDALIRAGKKPAIVAECECSMSKIYLGREMDYFIYPTIDEVNDKAAELIETDKYDFIAVYNGNYDHFMHGHGPESEEALAQLRLNSLAFDRLYGLIKEKWGSHRTLVGFAMDHGCHEIDGGFGAHGLSMDEDLQITHFYKAI